MVSENNPEEVPNILKAGSSKNLESVKRICGVEFKTEAGIINLGMLCAYLVGVVYISDKFEESMHILLIYSIYLFSAFIIFACMSLRMVTRGLDSEKKIDVIDQLEKFMEKNSGEKSYDGGNIFGRAATIGSFVVAIILCVTTIIYRSSSRLPYILASSIGIVTFLLVFFWYRNK